MPRVAFSATHSLPIGCTATRSGLCSSSVFVIAYTAPASTDSSATRMVDAPNELGTSCSWPLYVLAGIFDSNQYGCSLRRASSLSRSGMRNTTSDPWELLRSMMALVGVELMMRTASSLPSLSAPGPSPWPRYSGVQSRRILSPYDPSTISPMRLPIDPGAPSEIRLPLRSAMDLTPVRLSVYICQMMACPPRTPRGFVTLDLYLPCPCQAMYTSSLVTSPS